MATPQEYGKMPDLNRRAFLATSGLIVGMGALYPRALHGLPGIPATRRTQGAAERYAFELGKAHCIALCDGVHEYTAQQFFTNAPAAELAPVLAAHHVTAERIPSAYTTLFVDAGGRRVLLDTGIGPVAPQLGHLNANLRAADLDPKTVEMVVITHAHPDHVGGLVGADGQPLYPNAHYAIWQSEWEFWSDEANLAHVPPFFADIVRRNLLPLKPRLTLIDRDQELVPGIHALAAPGHTPGHMVVAVESAGKTLLFTSDAALHPIHLERPEWYAEFDMDHTAAVASRRRIFERAAAEHALVLAYHFDPFPSLGHVSRKGAGWAWEPVATTA